MQERIENQTQKRIAGPAPEPTWIIDRWLTAVARGLYEWAIVRRWTPVGSVRPMPTIALIVVIYLKRLRTGE